MLWADCMNQILGALSMYQFALISLLLITLAGCAMTPAANTAAILSVSAFS